VWVDDHVRVDRVRLPQSNRQRLWRYANALEKYCREEPPEVLQLFASTWEMVPAFSRIRRLGIPILYTDTMMLNQLSPNPAKRLIQQVYWAGPFSHSSAVVVSSTAMKRALQDMGVRVPIHVISNGVDLDRFSPADDAARESLREKLGLPIDCDMVVYVGSMSRRKGVHLLLEAWLGVARRHPRAQLVLVGPSRSSIRPWEDADEFERRLQELLDAPEARGSVHMVGPVDDVSDYIRAANLFVFPSAREGMPNVVLEAYASGVACVSTPFRGLSEEFGRPGHDYVLVERNVEQIQDGILRLIESPDDRTQLARNARDLVEKQHGVDESLDTYVELYRSLAIRSG